MCIRDRYCISCFSGNPFRAYVQAYELLDPVIRGRQVSPPEYWKSTCEKLLFSYVSCCSGEIRPNYFYCLKELKILDKLIGVNFSRETSRFRVTCPQRLHKGDFSLKTINFQPFARHFDEIRLKNTRFVSYFDVLDNPRAKVWFHTRQHIVWHIQASAFYWGRRFGCV